MISAVLYHETPKDQIHTCNLLMIRICFFLSAQGNNLETASKVPRPRLTRDFSS